MRFHPVQIDCESCGFARATSSSWSEDTLWSTTSSSRFSFCARAPDRVSSLGSIGTTNSTPSPSPSRSPRHGRVATHGPPSPARCAIGRRLGTSQTSSVVSRRMWRAVELMSSSTTRVVSAPSVTSDGESAGPSASITGPGAKRSAGRPGVEEASSCSSSSSSSSSARAWTTSTQRQCVSSLHISDTTSPTSTQRRRRCWT
mmetsp:Transcript_14571/g.58192  ORF Transcript_14571/g.58192 Transcript_14571/m.58192 type:complete len:201 (-) Transcript_14571:109-711(-)